MHTFIDRIRGRIHRVPAADDNYDDDDVEVAAANANLLVSGPPVGDTAANPALDIIIFSWFYSSLLMIISSIIMIRKNSRLLIK